MKELKLSIITINYNDALGLKKTMTSVLEQEYTDFEYIVVDGASSDDSVSVIKSFDDKRLKWLSEKDSGIYNAMNKVRYLISNTELIGISSTCSLCRCFVYNLTFHMFMVSLRSLCRC